MYVEHRRCFLYSLRAVGVAFYPCHYFKSGPHQLLLLPQLGIDKMPMKTGSPLGITLLYFCILCIIIWLGKKDGGQTGRKQNASPNVIGMVSGGGAFRNWFRRAHECGVLPVGLLPL